MTELRFFESSHMIETLLWIDANPGSTKTECIDSVGNGGMTVLRRIEDLANAGFIDIVRVRERGGPNYLFVTDRGARVVAILQPLRDELVRP